MRRPVPFVAGKCNLSTQDLPCSSARHSPALRRASCPRESSHDRACNHRHPRPQARLPGAGDPILQRHRERCLGQEPGTLAFEVLIPERQPDQILLYERYASREAFDAHWNGSSMELARAEVGDLMINLTGVFCTPAD